jgi:Ca-activated chloride channel family protein
LSPKNQKNMIKRLSLLFTSTLPCTSGRALSKEKKKKGIKGRKVKGRKDWLLLLLLLFFFTPLLDAQASHRALRSGNKAYKDQNFTEAKSEYSRALEADNSAKGNYNLGNALFEGGDYEQAAKKYEEAASLSTDPTITSSAYRNLGDAQYQQENYQESVEAYKQSLRIKPDDKETKYNLSKAIRQLQQQQEQQNQQNQENQDQQDQQDQQQQDQEGQGQQQDQQDQDQQSEGEQQQDQQQQQQNQQQQDPQKESSQNQQGEPQANNNQPKMSREEAERQLAIAAEAEKETMKNLQKGARSGCKGEKGW